MQTVTESNNLLTEANLLLRKSPVGIPTTAIAIQTDEPVRIIESNLTNLNVVRGHLFVVFVAIYYL